MQIHNLFGLAIKLHSPRRISIRLTMVMLALGIVWFSGQAAAVTPLRTETINDSPIAISSSPGLLPLPTLFQHVSGDRVAYSISEFSPTCPGERFWSYKFGGTAVPFDCSSPPAVEFLSPDISGHIAVYKKLSSSSLDPEALYIKDLDSTSAPIHITAAKHHPIFPSIGANTVAWIDGFAPTSSSPYGYQPLLYDLTTQLTTALGPSELGYNYGMTSVSESGDVVAWVKCESSNSFNCSVFRGLKSGGNWTVAQVVNWTNGVSVGSVSTNGQWIVTSTSGTGTLGSNIRWLPVALDEQGNPGPMEQLDLGASLANETSF